jgi:hypothetical protein
VKTGSTEIEPFRSRGWPARLAAYAWTAPNSLLGLIGGIVILALGGRVDRVHGVAEFTGGRLGLLFASAMLGCPFRAMTLGHVILATDRASIDCARDHEHVHVRQYEAWGPFFLPAYIASSGWQLVCGRRCYRDNWFERQAFDAR